MRVRGLKAISRRKEGCWRGFKILATADLAWCLSSVMLSAYLRSLVVGISTPSKSNTVGCSYSLITYTVSRHKGPKALRCSVWLLLIPGVENSTELWDRLYLAASGFACRTKTGYYKYWRHIADIDGFALPPSS